MKLEITDTNVTHECTVCGAEQTVAIDELKQRSHYIENGIIAISCQRPMCKAKQVTDCLNAESFLQNLAGSDSFTRAKPEDWQRDQNVYRLYERAKGRPVAEVETEIVAFKQLKDNVKSWAEQNIEKFQKGRWKKIIDEADVRIEAKKQGIRADIVKAESIIVAAKQHIEDLKAKKAAHDEKIKQNAKKKKPELIEPIDLQQEIDIVTVSIGELEKSIAASSDISEKIEAGKALNVAAFKQIFIAEVAKPFIEYIVHLVKKENKSIEEALNQAKAQL